MNRTIASTFPAMFRLSWKSTFAGGFQVLAITAMAIIIEAPVFLFGGGDKTLIPSVRIQLACFFSWLIMLTWGAVKAATLGSDQNRGNMAMFWNCIGVPSLTRFIATGLPVILAALMTATTAAVIYCLGCGWGWDQVCAAFEFVVLLIISVSGFIGFALGLSTAISPSASAVMVAVLAIYSMYGVQVIGLLRGKSHLITAIWACSPQIWMGDFTQRLVFNWGPLGVYDFINLLGYCTVWSTVFGFAGYVIFKRCSGGVK